MILPGKWLRALGSEAQLLQILSFLTSVHYGQDALIDILGHTQGCTEEGSGRQHPLQALYPGGPQEPDESRLCLIICANVHICVEGNAAETTFKSLLAVDLHGCTA